MKFTKFLFCTAYGNSGISSVRPILLIIVFFRKCIWLPHQSCFRFIQCYLKLTQILFHSQTYCLDKTLF